MIENKTADTILQEPEVVTIAGRQYKAPRPTTATLIRISELIAGFPRIQNVETMQAIIETTLANAWKCGKIGLIAATLVLGITKTIKEEKSILNRLFNRNPTREELAEIILVKMTPKETNELITRLLSRLEIADFFVLITSLSEINLTKATKEVMKETTASGL